MNRLLTFSLILFTLSSNSIFSQDFYIPDDGNRKAVRVSHSAPSDWNTVSENEAAEFLRSYRYERVEKRKLDFGVSYGGIRVFDGYNIRLDLVFQNQQIVGNSLSLEFGLMCVHCSLKDFEAQGLTIDAKTQEDWKKTDCKSFEIIRQQQYISLMEEGYWGASATMPAVNCDEKTYKHEANAVLDGVAIKRTVRVEPYNNLIFDVLLTRMEFLLPKAYLVGDLDLKEINQYDLKLMVDVFLDDCQRHGIKKYSKEVKVVFDKLEGDELGISQGGGDDGLIDIRIDAEKWASSSPAKRWYILYHELGHDVLNLEHGEGGKMMFPMSDKGYTWEEFWKDREYMFESCKR